MGRSTSSRPADPHLDRPPDQAPEGQQESPGDEEGHEARLHPVDRVVEQRGVGEIEQPEDQALPPPGRVVARQGAEEEDPARGVGGDAQGAEEPEGGSVRAPARDEIAEGRQKDAQRRREAVDPLARLEDEAPALGEVPAVPERDEIILPDVLRVGRERHGEPASRQPEDDQAQEPPPVARRGVGGGVAFGDIERRSRRGMHGVWPSGRRTGRSSPTPGRRDRPLRCLVTVLR